MSSTTIRYSGVPENSHSGGAAADSHTDAATTYGLHHQVDGFYDWAGRRLFLTDGSPDPLTPGAYRYQAHPDLCDLTAPEADPANPRYEPPHLRHQPGDTWQIGGKPYDVDDPGPYGNPLWRPDPRTGRHRRDELPDPLPHRQSDPGPAARFHPDPPEDEYPEPQPTSSGSVPPWRPRSRTASPPPEPPEHGPSGTNRPITPDRPRPKPRDESQFWSETDRSQQEHTMNHQRRNHFESETGPARPSQSTATTTGPDSGSDPSPHRFDKLREDAWDRFLDKSAELAAAHHFNRGTALERECGWQIALWVRLFRWLLAVLKGGRAKTEPPQPNPVPYKADPPVLPNQAGRSDQTGPTDRVGRAERARRTALATRSTRLASAVRGAQRARIETDSASSSAGTGPEADRPRSSSRPDADGPRSSSRSESVGALLFGGAAWA